VVNEKNIDFSLFKEEKGTAVKRKTVARRFGLFGLFILCGLLISVFPQLMHNKAALLISQVCITVGFLVTAVWLCRRQKSGLFQVTFAFFIMSFSFLMLYLLDFSGLFARTTVTGEFVFQLTNATAIIISILLLTRISGISMRETYVQKGRLRIGLIVGVGTFLSIMILVLVFPTGLSTLFYIRGDMTREKALSLMPIVIVYVLSNGFREELWFRGIFLKKFEPFIGASLSNIATSFVFAWAHVGVNYTPVLPVVLGITFSLGVAFAYMMQKTDSIIGPAIFHAAMDIPAVLAIFSFL
jgi:membrane protease YdiL (CAAX protease family)